eukprot:9555770-Heterocapsa_arctica.AAC.1
MEKKKAPGSQPSMCLVLKLILSTLEATDDHILLAQKHWRLPEEIETWETSAFHKGWHVVWHAGIRIQKTEDGSPGKSGGVAIL